MLDYKSHQYIVFYGTFDNSVFEQRVSIHFAGDKNTEKKARKFNQ